MCKLSHGTGDPNPLRDYTLPTVEQRSEWGQYLLDRQAGERFVKCLVNDGTIWNHEAGGERPWSQEAESFVENLVDRANITKGFIAGVLSQIRKARKELPGGSDVQDSAVQDPERGMAAGFLILSCFSESYLRKILPGIDFKAACKNGCEYNKPVVSSAANYTLRAIMTVPDAAAA